MAIAHLSQILCTLRCEIGLNPDELPNSDLKKTGAIFEKRACDFRFLKSKCLKNVSIILP